MLALLATATAPHRRAAAATITWLMMIFGIAMTAGVVGQLLDPYTPRGADPRRVIGVALQHWLITVLATWRNDRGVEARTEIDPVPFAKAGRVWAEPKARMFTIFVFPVDDRLFHAGSDPRTLSRGHVFGYTPGESTTLSGIQNGGASLAC